MRCTRILSGFTVMLYDVIRIIRILKGFISRELHGVILPGLRGFS